MRLSICTSRRFFPALGSHTLVQSDDILRHTLSGKIVFYKMMKCVTRDIKTIRVQNARLIWWLIARFVSTIALFTGCEFGRFECQIISLLSLAATKLSNNFGARVYIIFLFMLTKAFIFPVRLYALLCKISLLWVQIVAPREGWLRRQSPSKTNSRNYAWSKRERSRFSCPLMT